MPAVLPLSERLQAMFLRGCAACRTLPLDAPARCARRQHRHGAPAVGRRCRLLSGRPGTGGGATPGTGEHQPAGFPAPADRGRRGRGVYGAGTALGTRALAETTAVPERRVRHLAESAEGANPEIAFQLEVAARALLRQGTRSAR
ncbi:hypothetical protein NKG94_31150 [Micromonospora sp. M12]